MKKNSFILAGLIAGLFLFTGCGNATNNMNGARNYNSTVTNSPMQNNRGTTSDFIGRFFSNWENGRVTDDRYNSQDNTYNNISEPMDSTML